MKTAKPPRKPHTFSRRVYKGKTHKYCRRCKTVEGFPNRESMLCKTCQKSCVTCGELLTEQNSNFERNKRDHSYRCDPCSNASVAKNRDPLRQRKTYLKYHYGITVEEYAQMVDNQNHCCAICKKPNANNKKLHVDHKHTKGEKKLPSPDRQNLIRANVRGLVCWQCNRAIAMFRDDPSVLRNAADYLDSWPSKLVIKEPNNNEDQRSGGDA